ncbi:MAG: hypothetical protein COV75_03220 [Candidatus Omnitrophica bacterium CG11_big_fil_rev_8_21_14_0_20_63_9]|nr:MAG: hypothetical protein COV75_03220 [Candidatus Omnitrophica bacterium CG11_big_fil_rev_8_21_14_0_20_63_9]
MSTVALVTDFGTRDWYVGAIKGVVCTRAPKAHLIDITHDVPPQDVAAGAFTLAAAAATFPPKTVFLAVVDPGVGSRRASGISSSAKRSCGGPSRASARVRCRRHAARVVSSYMEGRAHEVVAVVGSLGWLELAVFKGSAARTLKARRGDRVELIAG